jgi:tRNA threonylcarbamoyladenosine biosynthesis protein TsaE
MLQVELMTHSSEETMSKSQSLGKLLQGGEVLLLEGDLGAGKTTFTKGLARGLDIFRNVNSPTFTIIKEYEGRVPLYHMDVYRLADSEEDLGFDDYFMGNGVTVVEWAHLIEDYLPEERLEIYIYHHGADERKLVFTPKGKIYEEICKELME